VWSDACGAAVIDALEGPDDLIPNGPNEPGRAVS
jgi:hypothetical protein